MAFIVQNFTIETSINLAEINFSSLTIRHIVQETPTHIVVIYAGSTHSDLYE